MGNLVAIVGRPNVGKSTLFNRLTKTRQAIVNEEAGTTRDRQYGKTEWLGREFSVVDTGGWVVNSDDIFEEEIRKQVLMAVDEADVILFVVDVMNGVTDLDEQVAAILRRAKKPVLLVANKTDNHELQYNAPEFYSLGLGDPYCISAVTGSGTGDMMDLIVSKFKKESDEILDEDIPRFAVVGRPNAGKSSIVNAFIGEDRNIVTEIAGTTRDSIYTRYNKFGFDFYLVDTAGIRKKNKVNEDLEYYSVIRSIRSIENADVCILMVDATRGIESQDLNIFSLIQKNAKGLVVVVNKWGNMHWGHSVSKDLIHWDHLNPAIARDTLGHIFSGSTVVDKNNSAGYGKDAIIAFYTSASDEHGQIQCMAYSKDNGRTYTKYEKNPILTPFDGLKDFRDPKVFWYEPAQKWYMIVSADKEMRFYSSSNLKDWEYQSGFGKGYGVQPNQFECPDFIQLPVDGDKNNMKWVMIVNINPGCMFGGSATEYFVGDFDGKEFKCDTKPEVTKWLDFGKDHYATVCFSNTGDRVVAVPWMSNWQYANVTPIRQYRGANALPRELSLYTKDGQIYMAANAVKETAGLRKETRTIDNQTVKGESKIDEIFPQNEGAFEIEMDVTPGASTVAGMELLNDKGEKTKIYLDMKAGKLVMDRTESGLVAFGEKAEPHAIENHDRRKTTSINYKNDFALGTWAPLSLCEGKTYHLQIFVDKCSVEIFANGGRIAMTNLVFPTKPYNSIRLYSEGGDYKVENMKIHKLGL